MQLLAKKIMMFQPKAGREPADLAGDGGLLPERQMKIWWYEYIAMFLPHDP